MVEIKVGCRIRNYYDQGESWVEGDVVEMGDVLYKMENLSGNPQPKVNAIRGFIRRASHIEGCKCRGE